MILKDTLITGLILVLMLSLSCTSQIPVATNYPYTEQQKMQAAHHWDVLATRVVKQLRKGNKVATTKPMYVVPRFYLPGEESPVVWTAVNPLTPAETSERLTTIPFKRAYYNFLITRLVNAGFNVVDNESSAALQTTFEIQLVKHHKRPVRKPHFISDIGRFIAGGDAAYTGIDTTEYEVIITTSVKQANAYILRNTNTYYIDKPIWDNNYVVTGKTMEVVNQ